MNKKWIRFGTLLLVVVGLVALLPTTHILQARHVVDDEQSSQRVEYLSQELEQMLNREIRSAIELALTSRDPNQIPGSVVTIISVRLEATWGLATVVSTRSPEYQQAEGSHDAGIMQPNLTGAILFVEKEPGWEVALMETPAFDELVINVPVEELSLQARAAFQGRDFIRSNESSGTDLKFPWGRDELWELTQGWHCDFYGCDALDYAPDGTTTREVLSVTNATVIGLCNPDNGNFQVQVRTRSTVGSDDWYYLHLDKSDGFPTIGTGLDQGDVIGKIYWANNYTDDCGYGSAPHVHLTAPSRFYTMDNWTVSGGNTWTRPGFPNRGVGALFESTNGEDSTPPDAPTGVAASDGTYVDRVRVSWNGVTEATGYKVYRATSVGGSKTLLGTPSGTTFDDTSAVEGTTYYYWVKASNQHGDSPFSSHNTGYVQVIPPTTTATFAGTWGEDDWYVSDVIVTLTADQPTNWIKYILNGTESTYSVPFSITTNGENALQFYAQDTVGNTETPAPATTIKIDKSDPVASGLSLNGSAAMAQAVTVQVAVTATDGESGLDEACLSYNQYEWVCQPYDDVLLFALPPLDGQTITVYGFVIDVAGNASDIVSDTIALDLYPEQPRSDNFVLCSTVMPSVAGSGVSSGYGLVTAGGQTATGNSASGSYMLNSGFLARDGCAIDPLPMFGYTLVKDVFAASGSDASSDNFQLVGTLGEAFVGSHEVGGRAVEADDPNCLTSANFQLGVGFWGCMPDESVPTQVNRLRSDTEEVVRSTWSLFVVMLAILLTTSVWMMRRRGNG